MKRDMNDKSVLSIDHEAQVNHELVDPCGQDWDQLAESEDEDAGAEAARMQAADSGDSDGDW